MKKLRLLDLFCKAGGCSMGYYQAGFDVTGVDIEPQKNYPFRFIQADAMTFGLDDYDVIHASPPCQRYSKGVRGFGNPLDHPDLLGAVRKRLIASGKPWVIENVEGAPVESGILLCGSMFGLKIRRHRLFESSFLLFSRGCCTHSRDIYGSYGHATYYYGQKRQVFNERWKRQTYNRPSTVGNDIGRASLGIDWYMTQEEVANAIPPAYTKYVGEQVLYLLREGAAV